MYIYLYMTCRRPPLGGAAEARRRLRAGEVVTLNAAVHPVHALDREEAWHHVIP